MQYNSTPLGTKRPNAYERARTSGVPTQQPAPALTFALAEVTGDRAARLIAYLRQYIPQRTSRYHEVIEQDAGAIWNFLTSKKIGMIRFNVNDYRVFHRPGALVPDVFADSGSYLIWSPTELPGTLMVIPVNVEGVGEVRLYVADVVSMSLALKYNGDESAMLAEHLEG